MSKKIKVLVAVLAAITLLTIVGASWVMAADEPPPPPPPADNVTALKGLLPRVAAILGIPESTLVAAFKQAERQIKDEAFLKALERAVASGRMTQEEANKLKEWWLQRPDVADGGKAPFARMFPRHGRPPLPPPGSGNITTSGNVTSLLPRVATILGITLEQLKNAIKQAEQEMQAEAFLKMLERAVARGIITQAEADQIRAWWQQRPEAVNRLLPQILKAGPHPGAPPRMKGGMRRHCDMMTGAGGAMVPGPNMPWRMGGGMMPTGNTW